MKEARTIYELMKRLRYQTVDCRKEITDSYFRLAEEGNWQLIREMFGLEKGR